MTADAAICGSVRSRSSGSNREEGRGQAFDGPTVVARRPLFGGLAICLSKTFHPQKLENTVDGLRGEV